MSYIQQFFTSRDNNANAATFVGQEGRLWWDPITNQIYSSDGNTPGGIPLAGGGGGNGSPGGANSQVQFNQNGNFGGSANLTFDRVSGALTAVSFAGDGAALTNITGANVSGTVANATYAVSAGTADSATTAATVTTAAQPNITSVGTLTEVISTGNISTTGNVTGTYILGNGSQLTGIVSNYGNANVVANLEALGSNPISTTGNITAGYFIGNGSQLTGIVSSYGNSNVAAYLPTYTGNLVALTGNVTTTANISGDHILGNGSALTSLTGANVTGTVANATYATTAGTVTINAQPNITSVGTLTGANISGEMQLGNLSGTRFRILQDSGALYIQGGNGIASSGASVIFAPWLNSLANATMVVDIPNRRVAIAKSSPSVELDVAGAAAVSGNITSGNLLTGGLVSATGNVTGNYFIGNGSQLTGLGSANVGNANYATTAGSTTQLVNGSSTVALYSDGTMSFPSGLINTSSNTIGLWSTNSTSLTWRTPTATTAGQPFQSVLQLSNAGITITALSGNVSSLTTKSWGFAYNGNLLFPDSTVQTTAFTGTAATVTTNAQPNITSVGTLTSVSSTGNVTGGNLLTGGTIYVTSSAAGAGEIKFSGATELSNIVAVGAIGNTLAGNGSINLVTGSASGGNIGFYVAQTERGRFTSSGLNITGNASASGNVTGGNLIGTLVGNVTGTTVSVTGNITGGNLNAAGLSLSGNVISAINTVANITTTANVSGGNLLTSGLISATGNITGGNINTGAQVVATGNITGGNINTGAQVVATGNITGGNLVTGGLATITGNVQGGNLRTAGQVSATGTITSNGGTNATGFAVGNAAVSNVALGFFPTAGTPGEYAIRDHSTVATSMYFDAGVGGSANSVFNFRTSNAYTTLATINSYGLTLTTNRPAFRVTGAGTTNNLTTTQNGTGALNGNNWAADYTQGSGLNSTTGVFTAPVAGLYQINVVGRNSGYSSGISQLAVVKNASGGTGAGGTVACMIEWAASSSMNHVGSGTILRLAVNDTLALKVLAGQINFDGNDNWSIAYLG